VLPSRPCPVTASDPCYHATRSLALQSPPVSEHSQALLIHVSVRTLGKRLTARSSS
jgi:hypothetical protein